MARFQLMQKIDFTEAERSRNMRIVLKIIDVILLPVLTGILIGWGSWITFIVGLIWLICQVAALFYDKEALVIEIIWRLLSQE